MIRWKELLILGMVIFFQNSYAYAEQKSFIRENERALDYVETLVIRGKQRLSASAQTWLSPEYTRATLSVFREAEDIAEHMSDEYVAALAYLLIAEGYSSGGFPSISRLYSLTPKREWWPYKDSMKALDRALQLASWLKYNPDYPDRYGFMGDIFFFVHLQYDKLGSELARMPVKDEMEMISPDITETPERICYTRGLQALERAIEAERRSRKSVARRRRGIERYTAKAYLYGAVRSRFRMVGVSNETEQALIFVTGRGSLGNMARWAAEESNVPFSETTAFRFFDILGDIFIPKYGLAKKALDLIF